MSYPIVDTFPAGSFICNECGTQCFYSLVPVGEGEVKKFASDIMEIAGYSSDICTSGMFALEPEFVECYNYKTKFTPFHGTEEDIE